MFRLSFPYEDFESKHFPTALTSPASPSPLRWTFTSISPNRWREVNDIVCVKKDLRLAYGNGQAFTN